MTPLTPQTRERLLRLLPAELHSKAIVAGSYLVDPEQAGDIDLWILNGHLNDYMLGSKLKTHLESLGINRYVIAKARAAGLGAVEYSDDEFEPLYQLLPSVTGLEKPVQIICTVYTQPTELVNSFDIPLHMVGECLADGVLAFGDEFTPLGRNVVVRSTEDRAVRARHSLERMAKFADRYSIGIDAADWMRLTRLADECDSMSTSDAA